MARKLRERERESLRSLINVGSGRGSDEMRREVEGYREQVLLVYPDMEFGGTQRDRSGGSGYRECGWGCCSVM